MYFLYYPFDLLVFYSKSHDRYLYVTIAIWEWRKWIIVIRIKYLSSRGLSLYVVCTIKNNPRIILFEVKMRRHRDKFAWIAYFRRPVYPCLARWKASVCCVKSRRYSSSCRLFTIDAATGKESFFFGSRLRWNLLETSERTTWLGRSYLPFWSTFSFFEQTFPRVNGDKDRNTKKIDEVRLIRKP